MSLVFNKDPTVRQKVSPGHSTIQKLLDENAAIIQTLVEHQNLGRLAEASEMQMVLHRNLMYLAGLADNSQLLQDLQTPLDQNNTTQQTTNPSSNQDAAVANVSTEKENRPSQSSNPSDFQVRNQQQGQLPSSNYSTVPPVSGVPTSAYYMDSQITQQAQQSMSQQLPPHSVPATSMAPQSQQQQIPQQMSTLQQQLQHPNAISGAGPMGQQQQQQQQPPPMAYSQPQMPMQMPQHQQYYAYQQPINGPAAGPQAYQQAPGPGYQQQPRSQGAPPVQQQPGDPVAAAYYGSQVRYTQYTSGAPPGPPQHPAHMTYQQQQPAPMNYQSGGGAGASATGYGQQHMRPMGYPQQANPAYSQAQQMGGPMPQAVGADQQQQQHVPYPGVPQQMYMSYPSQQQQQQQQPSQQQMGPPAPPAPQGFSAMPNA